MTVVAVLINTDRLKACENLSLGDAVSVVVEAGESEFLVTVVAVALARRLQAAASVPATTSIQPFEFRAKTANMF